MVLDVIGRDLAGHHQTQKDGDGLRDRPLAQRPAACGAWIGAQQASRPDL